MTIPKKQKDLIQLATSALNGAIKHEESVDLQQNKSAKIANSVYNLVGEPGAGPNAGKQGQLNSTRSALAKAEADRKHAVAEARTFCAVAVDRLKGHLGRNWNAQWIAAGFGNGSLKLPLNPLALLLELRGYFRQHPEHEGQNPEVSAARAEALAVAIQEANRELANAKSARSIARKERDAAALELRSRMSGLRAELGQLLPDDDSRWVEFGLSRPIDGRIPSRVTGLTLRPAGAGEVIASWERSVQAEKYRVTYQLTGKDPVELGLVADPLAVLRGLPSASTVTVIVTARNASGETLPTEERIVVA